VVIAVTLLAAIGRGPVEPNPEANTKDRDQAVT